jgi:hypothetical protein
LAFELSKGFIPENLNGTAGEGGDKKKEAATALKELRKISSFLSEI